MEDKSFSPQEYLENSSSFEKVEVLNVFEGHNNLNYIFASERGKFVLRKRNQISDDENVLIHEKKILEFLSHQNVDSTPKSIQYDSERQIHIISFTGEKPVNLEEMGQVKLVNWVENLCEIHKLQFQDFQEFCRERDYSFESPETPYEKLDEMEEKLENVRSESEHINLVKFCEEKIDELRDSINLCGSEDFYLNHSDLANSTRKTDNNYFLIDWEYASFNMNPISDIAILFVHRNLDKNQRKTIKQSYKQNMGLSKIESKLKIAENYRIVFNILWTLKRTNKSPKNSEKHNHLEFALKQKEKYNKNF